MAQDTDIIDLRRSYVPLDPNALPVTLHSTQAEDTPEAKIPVIPYDGYNFMPTPQGYASFFGMNSTVGIENIYDHEPVEAVEGSPAVPWSYSEDATLEEVKRVAYENHHLDWGGAPLTSYAELLTTWGVSTDDEFIELMLDSYSIEAMDIKDALWQRYESYMIAAFGERGAAMGGGGGGDTPIGYTYYPDTLTLDDLRTALWSVGLSGTGVASYEDALAWFEFADETAGIASGPYMDAWDFLYVYMGSDARASIGMSRAEGELGDGVGGGGGGGGEGVDGHPAIEAVAAQIGGGTLGCVDDIFMIQKHTRENILVALCTDGIWIKMGNETGPWEQAIELDIPEQHRSWSKCVIDNTIYVYRQAEPTVWIANVANDYVFTAVAPTGINMEGQLGIFKAGGRLGFWDSENSTGWSSLTSPTAFGNSDELSGFTIFQDIVGRIVVVLQHGDGFVIYCTKSIVHVRRNPASAMLFSGSSIFNNNGISYRREACFADPDTLHFAFTTQGLAEITNGQAQLVMPEIATYLKEKRQPVYLQVLNGRYLHFHFLDPYYVQNELSFTSEMTAPSTLKFNTAIKAVDDWNEGKTQNPCRALVAAETAMNSMWLSANGFTNATKEDATDVPIWWNYIATSIYYPLMLAWKNYTPGFFGDYQYFINQMNEGHFRSYTEFAFVPVPLTPNEPPDTDHDRAIEYTNYDTASFTDDAVRLNSNFISERNNNDFYQKQEYWWWAEERFMNDWKTAVERFDNGQNKGDWIVGATPAPYEVVGYSEWILDRSFQGEANRTYGVNDECAWLQRNFGRIFRLKAVLNINHDTRDLGGGNEYRESWTVYHKSWEYRSVAPCLFSQIGYTHIQEYGHYEGNTLVADYDDFSEDPKFEDACEVSNEKKRKPMFNGRPIDKPWNGTLCGLDIEFFFNDENFEYSREVTIPGGSILLQHGSDEPICPTFLGAHVFDIQYKKWGKIAQDYKLIMDFFPINNVSGDSVPYDSYLPRTACLGTDGLIYIFDQYPVDSYICFGKYGSNRKGFTDLHEIRIQNRKDFTGAVTVQSSINGRDIEPALSYTDTYENARHHTANMALSARWYNVIIEGNFDLIHLEARSTRAGRR